MSDADKGQTGGWEPIPQSEGYDGDATAFVQLPPDFMLDGVPLEAPGHGYVPPMITPLQPLAPAPAPDPAATGNWTVHVPTEAQQTQYFTGGEYGEGAYQEGSFREGSYEEGSLREGSYEDGSLREGSYEDGSLREGSYEGGSFGEGAYENRSLREGSFQEGAFQEGPFEERSFEDGSFGDGSVGGGSFEDGSFEDGSFRGGERFQPPAYVENAVEHLDAVEQDPHATAEWRFEGDAAPAADPGATGQWQISAATEDVPLTGGTPASYAEAPATLPGGAPAPWAVAEEPKAAPEEPATALEEPATALEEPAEATEDGGETAGEAEQEPAQAESEAEAAPGDGPAPAHESVQEFAPESVQEFAPEDAAPAPEHAAPEHAVPAPALPVDASTDSDEHPHTSYTLRVNGTDRPVTGSWIGESLLYVLRERLGLAGAKDGCSQGECGACNVQVDGRLVASCLVPAATAAGSEVRTVEGLATDGEPSDVQRAMARCGTVQCGFCIPGMCMTVHDLLEGNHAPTELETRQALAGNLCRCSGYRGVLDAVRDVVAEREAAAQAGAPETAGEPRVPHQIPHPHDGGMA
ncbi:2Fe-2S iron-sulfur cluster-binding protein [Streptomyces sp. NPDC059083]|uniref:(2Fe-2S)-binding protein n=1 Tax=unclassified Streptomyces TaxID=2593676 RepID=UPI00369D21DA